MKEIAAGHFLYHCDENDMGGMDDGNKPQISIQENSAALFLEITAEYDSDWQDEHSLISTKTSQIHILDEDHAELQKALDAAEEKGLDLVNISPKANPPVCKIMDYGKFRYEQNNHYSHK